MNVMGLLTSLLNNKRGSSSLEQLAGSLLAGGQRSMGGKSSILLTVGTLAWKAYQDHQKSTSNTNVAPMDSKMQLFSGMREPENETEEQEVNEVVFLMLKAMINAAKADGKIDDVEMEKIVGKAKENGISDDEQHFIMEEINKPMDTDSLIQATSNPQIAAQIYSVSLLAIDNDTEAEDNYLNDLAKRLGLSRDITELLKAQINQ